VENGKKENLNFFQMMKSYNLFIKIIGKKKRLIYFENLEMKFKLFDKLLHKKIYKEDYKI